MVEEMQIVPAAVQKDVEAQFVEMMVPLYSHGCERKIKKALSHFKGIYSINVDFKQQKVTVWGICNKDNVLSTVKSKRKGARFWHVKDNAQSIELEAVKSQTTPSSPTVSSPSRCPKQRYAPSTALKIIKDRSLSLNWRAWKKIFFRSNSF